VNQQPMMQNPRPAVSKWLWIILIIVVVIAAGFFGWYYLMGPGKKTTTTTTTPTTTSTTPSAAPTTTPAVAPQIVAKNFYNYYLTLVDPNGKTDFQGRFQSTTKPYKLKTGFSDYLTATLISNLESQFNSTATNTDPIFCNAQDIPDDATYDVATITNDTATSVVNMHYAPVKKATLGYIVDGNNWKINSITCQ